MKKVNEFVNSDNLKEKFDKLDRIIFLETAHLANFFQLDDNKHYKIMLENLNDFLPFIVDKIINDEYKYVHKLLISKVADFDKENFKESVSNWWEENTNSILDRPVAFVLPILRNRKITIYNDGKEY